MTTRDLKNNVAEVQSLAPAAYTSSTNGSTVDLRGFDSAQVIIDVGSWTDGTHTFEVQESSDDSTWTAVADDDLDGDEPVVDGDADDDQVYVIGYSGVKRYLRVVSTVESATTGALYSAMVQRGHPNQAPA